LEPKTVFDIFCHYDILFSIISAYHKKENLIVILIAISVFNEFAKNVHNTNYSKVSHPTPVFLVLKNGFHFKNYSNLCNLKKKIIINMITIEQIMGFKEHTKI